MPDKLASRFKMGAPVGGVVIRTTRTPENSKPSIHVPHPASSSEGFVKLKQICELTSLGPDFFYAHPECPRLRTPKYLLFRVSEVLDWLETFRSQGGE